MTAAPANRVVDASALVAALIDTGPDGEWADSVLVGATLCAPHLVISETANILRRAELSGDIDSTAAAQAHDALLALPLQLFDYEPMADRIWALRHNLTIYDAQYVALAEALECELATLDRKLASASGPQCRFITPPTDRVGERPGR